jgi:hypothetical protein
MMRLFSSPVSPRPKVRTKQVVEHVDNEKRKRNEIKEKKRKKKKKKEKGKEK